MPRTKENYLPTNTLTTAQALMACHDAIVMALARWSKGEATVDEVKLPIDLLLAHLPRGSITKARLAAEAPHAGLIAVTVKDRNERFLEPEAFLLLSSLVLCDLAGLHFNETSKDETKRLDYLKVFAETGAGITALRILADAHAGEVVTQIGDHHDLSALNLVVTPGPRRSQRGRREALAEALKAYDKNAKEWGLSDQLSRWAYQRLLRDCFRLYDMKHAHRHIRAIGEQDAA